MSASTSAANDPRPPSSGSPRTSASPARCSPATRPCWPCAAKVRELAEDYTVAEVVADPWRFQQSMLELAERGITVTEFPQSNARMGPASERLHAAITEQRLRHPNDPVLNAHVRQAIARDTPRGWRIDKAQVARQHRRVRRAGDGGRGRGGAGPGGRVHRMARRMIAGRVFVDRGIAPLVLSAAAPAVE